MVGEVRFVVFCDITSRSIGNISFIENRRLVDTRSDVIK